MDALSLEISRTDSAGYDTILTFVSISPQLRFLPRKWAIISALIIFFGLLEVFLHFQSLGSSEEASCLDDHKFLLTFSKKINLLAVGLRRLTKWQIVPRLFPRSKTLDWFCIDVDKSPQILVTDKWFTSSNQIHIHGCFVGRSPEVFMQELGLAESLDPRKGWNSRRQIPGVYVPGRHSHFMSPSLVTQFPTRFFI